MIVRVPCQVSAGLRDKEATVRLTAYDGRGEFLPVDRDMVVTDGGQAYLPVHVLHIDREKKAALVGLPIEADSGAHQIWVRLDGMKNLPEGLSA